ncbi:hypothetical protein Tco_1561095 [Tanacetum coccineum]
MPPKRTATTTPTTPMTDAQIKALIARGIADALAERDADRSRNGDDSHDSGGNERRRMPVAREIKKLEIEMWNLKVKGTDVLSYNQCFQELELMCERMFLEESDKVEKYVGGLSDMIHGSVMASKPKTMQDAIKFANELMDHKIRTIAERQAKNKRKFDDNNQTQQQPPRSKMWQGLILVGLVRRRSMMGLYHCATSVSSTTMVRAVQSAQNARGSDCPELKNRNHENQNGGTEARGMVYALGGRENNQDLDDMEDDVNA